MHGRVRRRPSLRDERGAVAIVVAACMTVLLVTVAMVLDFGLVRVDRQVDRAAADDATLAGLHALNTGDGAPHPFMGVCTAIRYLRANSARFAGADETTGWRDGLGAATANGCSDAALQAKVCKPTDKSTWASWRWTGVSGGLTLDVQIQSGYDLAANTWREDSLPATNGDNGLSASQGCDNLAVTIRQSRKPGLGSLATSSDLQTSIRTVGRIRPQPGDSAPAMLLLKRTGCPVLTTGAGGGQSFIRVAGAISTDGKTQPGTIHADTDAAGCNGGNNGWIYGGLANLGIVAYAAPLASNPTAVDPGKPGSITSTAVANGFTGSGVRDSLDHVHGSSALGGSGGVKTEVAGRPLVTRGVVDDRYFAGVKSGVAGAASLFSAGSSGPPDSSWVTFPASVDACKPTQGEVNALSLTAASRLYVDCTTNAGFGGPNTGLTINAGTVFFRGLVSPSSQLKLPNAHHVYVRNAPDGTNAVNLSNNTSFEVNTAGNLDASGNCSTGLAPSKAVVFVQRGQFKQTGGVLRMCRTSVILMGGRSDGCVPGTSGTAPSSTPCTGVNGGLGSGQFTQNGGDVDWTAPNALDATTDAGGGVTPEAVAAWGDPNGPEDLALWSESGTNSSSTYGMTGGGLFRVRGVFMVPNAEPFIISGGASLNLTNAQYVASSVRLNGNNTNITMSVDPNAAVTVPDIGLVGLVR